MQIWAAFSGNLVYTHTQQYRIFGVSWSPDSKRIASGSFDGSVQTWDAMTGNDVVTYRDRSSPIYATRLSPNGAYIASGGEDKAIQVWEVATGRSICEYQGHNNSVKSLAWSPDSKYIASGSDDKTVQIWDCLLYTSPSPRD